MSGICAVWRRDRPEQVSETLAAVSGGLLLDASERVERLSGSGIGLGISARFATQQVYQDPQVMIACDVDLTNEEELRSSVGLRKDAGTGALLGALYDRFGSGFVEKLRGGFSFVLWDRRERKLLAAVDGVGVKRLAYYHDRNVFLIASRIDALTRYEGINREINPRAIANVLNFSANLAPETIFANVHRLGPGKLLHFSDGHVRLETYWDMRYGGDDRPSEERLSRELDAVVERSVATHCHGRSPEGIGAFLSGGTDSSTVVGMMARVGQRPVKAFSIGFQEQSFNELEYAAIAAKKFGAEHHTYLVGPEDCFDALPRMIASFDEPFGNSSAIPTYFCARLAAQHGVGVLLAGDGGDEMFGGNEWYAKDKIFGAYQSVPSVLRKGLIEPILVGLPMRNGLMGKARSYVRRSNLPGLERIMSYHFLRAHAPLDVFERDFAAALADYSVMEVPARYYAQAPAHDHLNRMLYSDVKIILGDSDLPKVTTMSELAGVQVRFPFLDRSVAEFSGRIPANLKVKGFQKRYLFKRAFHQLLPLEIREKKKHGFGIPVSIWLKSDRRMRELAHDSLLSTRAFGRGYFRRDFIEDLFRKHEADDTSYYGDTLWTFLALELWHRQFVDAPVQVAV
jgi:asparagine synthase (glutamine-hydrolysing)